MKAIQTSSGQIDIQEILIGIRQLKRPDLEVFIKQALSILEKKKSPDFLKKEEDLIHQIKNGGPDETFWKKYDVLANKLRKETMLAAENQTFIQMNASVEQWAVERLLLMVELSELWNTTLDNVRIQLDIKPRAVNYV